MIDLCHTYVPILKRKPILTYVVPEDWAVDVPWSGACRGCEGCPELGCEDVDGELPPPDCVTWDDIRAAAVKAVTAGSCWSKTWLLLCLLAETPWQLDCHCLRMAWPPPLIPEQLKWKTTVTNSVNTNVKLCSFCKVPGEKLQGRCHTDGRAPKGLN